LLRGGINQGEGKGFFSKTSTIQGEEKGVDFVPAGFRKGKEEEVLVSNLNTKKKPGVIRTKTGRGEGKGNAPPLFDDSRCGTRPTYKKRREEVRGEKGWEKKKLTL